MAPIFFGTDVAKSSGVWTVFFLSLSAQFYQNGAKFQLLCFLRIHMIIDCNLG
jgi:hypothetical protein